ncbi:MAG: hypothetical protein KF893_27130 [Caldilineaceae bacterium]|nr:hypothetical protein [Caldilineaceae bacterium]
MSVNVRSIDILLDLKQALARYAQEVIPPLDALAREAERTLEWLGERRRYWQRQVEERRRSVQAAQAALAQCEATVYRDSRGNVSRPDCSGLRAAVSQGVYQLREVEAELRKTEEARRAVEQAYEEFRRQRQHFQNYLGREGVQSQVFLDRRAASLRAYAATSLAGATPGGYSVTAPTDALAGMFTFGIVAGAVGLTSLAVAVIKKMAGHLQSNLGDTGETLAAKLLNEDLSWQALPFDQPKHGFDRIFSAPGLPLIIVECKVNRAGELHLGQTQDGEQASPQWIAARAAAMADPTSAQYSPNNTAIAALVEELGPENVPTVAVVITTETGAVDIHYRRGGSAAWEQLPEGADLTTLLQNPPPIDPSLPSMAPDPDPGPHYYPPEYREGNFGGPERRG